MGPKGAGTPAHFGIQADVLTGTLGKAMGGAIGGYIAGPQPVIDLMRQRARPYLFSNALPPAVVAAGLAAIDLVEAGDDLRTQLFENAAYWRAGLSTLGFDLLRRSAPDHSRHAGRGAKGPRHGRRVCSNSASMSLGSSFPSSPWTAQGSEPR